MEFLVGLDDTDSLESDHGTGRASRELATQLVTDHDIEYRGSVRQQFLLDPRVPYTTHNSAACLVLFADEPPLSDVIEDAGTYLTEIKADVADPGLCVVRTADVPDTVSAFGRRAQEAVVDKQTAYDIAETVGDELFLDEYGGTGDGVIGALGAVGLTAAGDSGRYIGYGDIREYGEQVAVERLREDGITVSATDGARIPDGEVVNTHDWVRPERRDGRPVLRVTPEGAHWKPANLST
jgi:tRNA(Ile2) C34 agmatinyltransferase TiaS